MARNMCRDFEYNLANNVKYNIKAFWKYCMSKMKTRRDLADLEMAAGKATSDYKTTADLVNFISVSVFTRENEDIPDSFDIRFITDTIEKKLKNLKGNKSAGPDSSKLFSVSLTSVIGKMIESIIK